MARYGPEAEFKKFAATYHILLQATLFFLLILLFREGKPEIIDLGNFKIWKLSFRSVMGLFAAMDAFTYLMFRNLYAYYDARQPVWSSYGETNPMVFEVLAMFFGFLSLLCFLMNLFGFWGIMCLPVSPPVVLLLVWNLQS